MKTLSAAILAIVVVFAVGTASGQAANTPKGNAGAQAACCMDSKAQMSQMDEHMQRMQALHDKMASAATPEERQKLMADQRQEMQQGMAMMHQMQPGGAMMGGAMMGGGAKSEMMGQKGKPADQKTQMQMMEKRMDMMQMMMQSMMDQQGASGGAMTPAPAK